MYCILSALLLALSHAGADPMICTLSNLGTVSAASRDYTKYEKELFPLHMQDVTTTLSNPKCFCKQSLTQTAAIVECWQLWITVKPIQMHTPAPWE